ncbi:MAG: hypothetical protein RL557_353 [archaeon]
MSPNYKEKIRNRLNHPYVSNKYFLYRRDGHWYQYAGVAAAYIVGYQPALFLQDSQEQTSKAAHVQKEFSRS